jgi:hypothetical protein
MFYEVKLSPPERALLGSLVGKPLDQVTTDRWAVELRSGTSTIRVVPEEIATPDTEHPQADVFLNSNNVVNNLAGSMGRDVQEAFQASGVPRLLTDGMPAGETRSAPGISTPNRGWEQRAVFVRGRPLGGLRTPAKQLWGPK